MIETLLSYISYGQTIIIFLFILSFLVFIHEWGHFIAAKKSGVKVEEFAIGLGPKIWSKQSGETLYRLNWVPFGGYVKMLGEEENSADPRSFNNASVFHRIWITLNGIIMNLLFTLVSFTVLFSLGKMVTIDTDGQQFFPVPQKSAYSLSKSFTSAVQETWKISALSIEKLIELPTQVAREKKIPASVSGPVGIAQVTHYVIPNGFWAMLRFAAVISLSLGVMNLLPLPALDGGRFFFQLLELIGMPFGVKLSDQIEQWVHMAGYFLLLALLLAISANDIFKLIKTSTTKAVSKVVSHSV